MGEDTTFVAKVSYVPAWKALRALIARPWFSRRWVIQEILLAREAVMYCGGKVISWHDLQHAIRVFISNLPDIRDLVRKIAESNFSPLDNRNLHISWNAYVHTELQVAIQDIWSLSKGYLRAL
jgi:hypothetical protein